MNIIKFDAPVNARQAEAEIVSKLKAVLYEYSNIISVAQAIGCIEIAKSELYWEQME